MFKKIHHKYKNKVLLILLLLIVLIYTTSMLQFIVFTSKDKFYEISSGNMSKKCIERDSESMYLFKTFGFDVDIHNRDTEFVLVLGSSGLIGSHLVKELKKQNYNVLEVKSRHHLDLRLNNSLNIFDYFNIKFVFFLAYEVGGAKFLQLPSIQDEILHSNIQMMDSVFNYLQRRRIRFVFASSSLSADNSTYGFVKRLGEQKTKETNIGRVARFWNVYGFEIPSPKSHILPDVAFKCITTGEARLLTKGDELRQFMHASDISYNLIQIMKHFDESPFYVDLSDGNWISVLTASQEIGKSINCKVLPGDKNAKKQVRHQPILNTTWHKKYFRISLSLENGSKVVMNSMKEFISDSTSKTTLTIIFIKQPMQEIVSELYKAVENLKPIKVQLLAPSSRGEIEGYSDFYDAFNRVLGETVLINDGSTQINLNHLMVYHHHLIQNNTLYFAKNVLITNSSLVRNQPLPEYSIISIHKTCNDIENIPYDYSYISASWYTIKQLSLLDVNRNPHDWFMELKDGYISVKLETPAWHWGDYYKIDLNEDYCCRPKP